MKHFTTTHTNTTTHDNYCCAVTTHAIKQTAQQNNAYSAKSTTQRPVKHEHAGAHQPLSLKTSMFDYRTSNVDITDYRL